MPVCLPSTSKISHGETLLMQKLEKNFGGKTRLSGEKSFTTTLKFGVIIVVKHLFECLDLKKSCDNLICCQESSLLFLVLMVIHTESSIKESENKSVWFFLAVLYARGSERVCLMEWAQTFVVFFGVGGRVDV